MTATAIQPTNVKGYSKYPLMRIEVGESFFVSVKNPNQRRAYRNAVSQAIWQRRDCGRKFTTKIEDGGVRCTRIE